MRNDTGILVGTPTDVDQSWWATVALVGIGLCIVIVILAIAFIVHHRFTQKEEQKKLRPVSEALLVNGDLPNSPSHSGGSLQGSQNISFSDPSSSSPIKRDYVLAKGSTAHPQDRSGGGRRGRRKKSPTEGPFEIESPERRSHHSSTSSLSQSHIVHMRSPTGKHSELPSPYQANATGEDFIHDPNVFTGDPQNKKRHRKSRQSDPSHAATVGSPSASTVVKPYIPRTTGGVPLADEEDLSPSTPASPMPHQRSPTRSKGHKSRESIPMDSYGFKHRPYKDQGVADTRLTSPPRKSEPRPPVEGRDSLHRRSNPISPSRVHHHANLADALKTPDKYNGALTNGGKPNVKPLPLRSIQRPDGQSPESAITDSANTPTATTPSSINSLSPSKLFPESHTPSEIGSVADGFEYDDYMPDLPGSYFTMDPSAYTLTWSSQQPWAKARQQAGSRSSIDNHETNA